MSVKAREESLMLRKLQRSGVSLGAKLLSKPCASGAKEPQALVTFQSGAWGPTEPGVA